MDHMSGKKDVINWNDTESILNILKKIRGKMDENRKFNLFIFIRVDIEQILKRDEDDALSSYHPVLKNDIIDEFIVKLNKNTIRDLMGKNEEFKHKILGKLSKILPLNQSKVILFKKFKFWE